jgi:hypothetical protein
MANGALDGAAALLGIETNAQRMAKKAEELGKLLQDPLIKGLQGVVDVGAKLQNLDTVTTKFENVRAEIDKVVVTTDQFGNKSVKNINQFANSFETAAATLVNKSAETEQAIAILHMVVQELSKGYASTADTQKLLTAAFNGVSNAAGKQVGEVKNANTNVQQNATISQAAGDENIALATAMSISAAEGKNVGVTLSENNKTLMEWLQNNGIAITSIEGLTAADKALLNELRAISPALETMGTHIELINGRSIDWTKTIGNMVVAERNLKAEGETLWTTFKDQIDRFGIPGLEAVEQGIRILEQSHHPLAKTIRDTFEEHKDHLRETGQFVEYLGTKEEVAAKKRESYAEKEKKDLAETADELGYKAEKYGILVDIQDKSIETQEVIIGYYDDEIKSGQELVGTLQEMAMARGMSADQVTEDTGKLLKWIETHRLEKVTTDEIILAVAKAKDAREQEAKSMATQTAAANHLLTKMKESVHVTGMSGEGLMKHIDIINEAKRATEIAADAVGLWYSELGKSQAVEEATREKLEEFAKLHEVKVPKSIRNGSVKAFQEYVTEVMNIALKTDEAMQMVQDAIDGGVSHLSGSFNKISSDAGKAFSEGEKAFKKFLKETGLDPNNALVLEGIVDMIMNDTEWNDDFTGFTENLASQIDTLKGATKGDITAMVSEWNTTIAGEMKDNPEALAAIQAQSDKIISTMNTILNSGKGIEPAEAFIAAVGEVLGKDEALKLAEKVFEKIPPTLAQKLKAGKNAVTSGVKEGIHDPLKQELSTGEDIANQGGTLIANEVGAGLEKGIPSVTQNATLMVDKITGEITEVPPNAEQELKPVEGIFSQAFLNASTAAGTQLQTMVTKLHTAMSSMSTSVKTYSDSMATNFGLGFLQKSAEAINLFTPAITLLQQTFSTLSTSVMTYSNSMKENLIIFVDESIIKLTELTDFVFNTVQLTFSNLSMNLLTYFTSMKDNLIIFVDESVLKLTELSDFIFNTVQLNFSNLSTSVATYMTSMGTNVATFATNATKSLTDLAGTVFNTAQKAFSNFSTSLATYTKSMGTNLTKFSSDGTKSLGDLTTKGVKVAHTGFQNMSTSVATYSKSMTSNVTSFASAAIKQLAGVSAVALGMGKNFGTSAGQIKSAMSQASSAIKSFSSAAVSALKKVESAAKSATSALNAMAAAARKAKSAASGLRYGGMLITGGALDASASYAQTGKSWVNTRPRKIGGVNISEFGKPELVQVTPLSNPSDPMDRAIDYTKVPGSKMENIPRKVETPNGFSSTGGGGRGGTQTVTGDLHITLRTMSGKVISQEIQPYLMEGYSNITS